MRLPRIEEKKATVHGRLALEGAVRITVEDIDKKRGYVDLIVGIVGQEASSVRLRRWDNAVLRINVDIEPLGVA